MNRQRCSQVGFGLTALGLTALCVIAAGCEDGAVSFNYNRYERQPRVEHRVVYVPETHVCGHGCHDHVYDGGRVVVVGGHRHGPGCGHDYDGHHWVIVGKARAVHVDREPAHVARVETVPSGAVRVYSPRRRIWIDIDAGHRHGPHCGHVHRDGRWCVHD